MVAATVAVAAVLIGMSKGGLRGLGSIGTILAAMVLPTTVAVGLMLPLMLIADAAALCLLWRYVDRSVAAPMIAGSVVGVAAASSVLASLSPRALEVTLALVILVFTGYRFAARAGGFGGLTAVSGMASGRAGVIAGVAAGVTSTVAHVGGPPVSIHLLARRIEPLNFAGTAVAVFVVVNWLKMPGYVRAGWFDRSLMVSLAPTAMLVVPGVFAGRAITARLDERRFELFILAGLIVGAGLLLAA